MKHSCITNAAFTDFIRETFMDCTWSIRALLMQHSRILLEKHSWIAHEAFVHFSSTRSAFHRIYIRLKKDFHKKEYKLVLLQFSWERKKLSVPSSWKQRCMFAKIHFLHSNIFSAPNNWISAAAGNWSWLGLVWLGLVSIKSELALYLTLLYGGITGC